MGHRCLSKRLQHPCREEMLHFRHRREAQGKASSCSVPEHFSCGWALFVCTGSTKTLFDSKDIREKGIWATEGEGQM